MVQWDRFLDRMKAHTRGNIAEGADGIAMEAFIFGGIRLSVHNLLFTLFIYEV